MTVADGAKRLRLEGPPSTDGVALMDLASLLQRLQAMLSSGGEPESLDSLLEELGRAQAGLNGSSQAAVSAIADAERKLQAAIVSLQAAVDRFTPPPGYRPPPSEGVDEAYVRGLLSYAHRLSYSSAAPLGFQPGQPLFFFKPPAPQEAEMRASQLHAFNREWEERQQALAAQQQAAARGAAVPATAQAAAAPAAAAATAAATPAAAAGSDLAALAAKLGLDAQQLLASMPAGWKPGDPLPLAPGPPAAGAPAAALAAPAAGVPLAAAAAAPAAAAAAAPPLPVEPAAVEEAEAQPPAPRLAGIFLNQLNFADLEYGVSSGDEDSDEEEDSD